MSEFTKEQLIGKLKHRIAVTEKYPDVEEAQLEAVIFKIALASLIAEPIGAFHISDQQVGATSDYIKDGEWPIDDGIIEVYAAPPAPVVSDEISESLASVQASPALDYLPNNTKSPATVKSVADLYEVSVPSCRTTIFTTDAAEAKDCAGMGWKVQEYVKLEKYQEAIMGNSPETPDSWIPVSERLPETDGNYWGWWSESKRQGPAWFIKSELQAQFQSSEITHWMPLPAAPKEIG